jgi:hypothetical protein
MTSSERPTPRSRPFPAADEAVDPVVSHPPDVAPLIVGGRRRGPEPTVQLNVRVASEVSALIDRAMASSGRTKRQLIEQAIRSTYSKRAT